MAEKNQVQVLVGGKVLTVSGYESEEYLEKVASYLNHKVGEFSAVKGYSRMASETKGTLLALNVADDYFKAKEKVEDLEAELNRKNQELLSLKQELVSLQVMRQNMTRDTLNHQNPSQRPAGNKPSGSGPRK
ncbi:MAG: cell division protein ZapA [Lachnospiraceae bacterium]|nr:cell division protein ZapA [Lachnospiraceae bacterium]